MADVRVKKEIEGTVPEGSAVAGNPVLIGLDDGTDSIYAQANTGGDLKVTLDSEQVSVLIDNNNVVSTNNSSAATLGISAVFTGTGEDISMYSGVSVQVFSSHASAASGLSMEFSADNSNWDEKHLATVDASTSREFIFPTHAQYFRIVYTNGGTGQSSFRLQTILHVQSIPSTAHSMEESTHADDVGILTKSTIVAQAAGAGDFVPVQATAGGNLKVAIEEADVSATGLAKAEDAVHSSGDVGVMALGVRNDILASLVDADGDYAPLQVNAAGALFVHNNNIIDPNNSTTTPLGISATYTGTSSDVSQYSTVTVTLDSSHDSAVDGMTFEFSTDDTNWDDVYVFTYTAVNGARRFQFPVTAQYFRIVYINGGTEQTTFRVQTICHDKSMLTTIHRIIDNVDPDRSAQIMKTAIIAQAAGTGDFVAVQATATGNLKMSIEEFDAGVSLPAGTNNIGDVDVLSVVPGVAATNLGKAESEAHSNGDVGVMALAVRNDDLADLGGADGDYSPLQVSQNGALLTAPGANDDYKYAVIDDASSGDNEIVALVASRKIRVLSMFMISAGTVAARFESDAAGTALTGQMNLIANSGFVLPFNPAGWFETVAGESLNLELSDAISVDGSLTYIEVL